MADPTGGIHNEGPILPDVFSVTKEYARCVRALENTGVVAPLPKSEKLGVVGIDGNEYPMPTEEQVRTLLEDNKELVDLKMHQGFTRLQLTPLAVPL